MNTALPMAPPAKSPLARYRLLSPSASIRVSPLCLGAMNFGDAWADYMGACDQSTTEGILDFFFEQAIVYENADACAREVRAAHAAWTSVTCDLHTATGNFIDTANNYQFGESEQWIGEWMKKRGNREQMVIATKFTTNFTAGPNHPNIMANFTGNGAKSLATSVNASLRKLQTDYIDLLYVHWWDYSTSIPELMQSLNHLVASGKVLHLGISDTPAWVVSKANEYARNNGLRQFSVYQGRWSAASRDFERDIIPMCKAEGMGICPWGALGGGKFKSEEQRQSAEGRQTDYPEIDVKASQALEAIAKRKNTAITSIALAYVMHKTPYVFPIVGGRKVEHLKGNIEALTIQLSDEDIKEIESAVPFELGFPHNFLWAGGVPDASQKVWLLNTAATFDYVKDSQPITPHKGGE
ncbi:Norsolorinic acid reductase A [Tolypocladium ophioglossoides CBS 100239]|uniref:Norsolorinic acid reductase A n=1 Tax=Tolypocladium ophioglossoides (strain CBS 100239) TaxID=1163406 RepID=A0A0L0N4H6_TOLOC|nr:Norsolorinic acid reductase A [Tolypocladium ophioglossoides CBS 100239]